MGIGAVARILYRILSRHHTASAVLSFGFALALSDYTRVRQAQIKRQTEETVYQHNGRFETLLTPSQYRIAML